MGGEILELLVDRVALVESEAYQRGYAIGYAQGFAEGVGMERASASRNLKELGFSDDFIRQVVYRERV